MMRHYSREQFNEMYPHELIEHAVRLQLYAATLEGMLRMRGIPLPSFPPSA